MFTQTHERTHRIPFIPTLLVLIFLTPCLVLASSRRAEGSSTQTAKESRRASLQTPSTGYAFAPRPVADRGRRFEAASPRRRSGDSIVRVGTESAAQVGGNPSVTPDDPSVTTDGPGANDPWDPRVGTESAAQVGGNPSVTPDDPSVTTDGPGANDPWDPRVGTTSAAQVGGNPSVTPDDPSVTTDGPGANDPWDPRVGTESAQSVAHASFRRRTPQDRANVQDDPASSVPNGPHSVTGNARTKADDGASRGRHGDRATAQNDGAPTIPHGTRIGTDGLRSAPAELFLRSLSLSAAQNRNSVSPRVSQASTPATTAPLAPRAPSRGRAWTFVSLDGENGLQASGGWTWSLR